MYQLRVAIWADIDECMEILASGREFQRAQGFVQWPDGYPDRATVEKDIEEGTGYVMLADGQICAYFYIGFEGDPAYPKIKGAWHHSEPYAVIHRIAIGSAFRGKGLADVAFRLAEEICIKRGMNTLRIYTDEQNLRMRHVLEKNGFAYCGTVVQGNGDRFAFDKKLG